MQSHGSPHPRTTKVDPLPSNGDKGDYLASRVSQWPQPDPRPSGPPAWTSSHDAARFAYDYPAVVTPLRWEATISSERLRVALEAEVKRNEKSRDESRLLAQKVALRPQTAQI